ncbi:uncharacterized protein LOC141903963 isoform X1 [Tubulanus polymorphus]|uniref:uncharacterized protein LOC141903963 isoform X1 n=1 Tax=Tubulanus polymorphus TaxID=672921 RepID=UPI003DA2AB48
MTSYQYHMEALRKQRVLERKQEALRRQAMANEDAQKIGNSLQYRTQMNDGNMSLEPDNRLKLDRFRLNDDGFWNRYRGRHSRMPHVDAAYTVMYDNNKDNTAYTCDENRNNRRQHLQKDKFDILRKLNGDFHVQVMMQTPH